MNEIPKTNASDILRKLFKAKGYSQAYLAEKAGLKRQSNLAELLRRNMRVDNLVMLSEAMDCELVIRSKTAIPREDEPGRMYKPEYIVELTEKETGE